MSIQNLDGLNGVKRVRFADRLSDFASVTCHRDNESHSSARVFDPECGNRWSGGYSSAKGYADFVAKGWPEGIRKMRDSIGQLQFVNPVSIKRRPVWSDQGDDVDMGRVYAGQLETAWRKTVRKFSSGPQHVRIWTDGCFNCMVNADKFFWRGAVSCLVVDALEQAGYRVQFNAYIMIKTMYGDRPSPRGPVDFFGAVRVKDYDQPLLLEQAAAITAHAGFLRNATFALALSTGGECTSMMGYPESSDDLPMIEPGDIVIRDVDNVDAARKKVKEIMARFENQNQEQLS